MFGKEERLCSKMLIDKLFVEGKSVSGFPVRAVFRLVPSDTMTDVAVLFGVPKRHLRHSVQRNRVKRQLREMYRASRESLKSIVAGTGQCLTIAFVFCDGHLWTTDLLSARFDKLLVKLAGMVESEINQGKKC